jgi:hypothetical protein
MHYTHDKKQRLFQPGNTLFIARTGKVLQKKVLKAILGPFNLCLIMFEAYFAFPYYTASHVPVKNR